MDYQELKRLAGYTSVRNDCSVERFDGIDLDAVLAPRLQEDYLRWLDGADPDMLRLEDVRTRAVLTSQEGVTVLTLPDDCRSLVAVRLQGWRRRADIIDADSGDVRLSRIGNEFAQPEAEHPLAVRRGRQYELWPGVSPLITAGVVLAEAIAVKL